MEAAAAPSLSTIIAALSAHGSALWLAVAYVASSGACGHSPKAPLLSWIA